MKPFQLPEHPRPGHPQMTTTMRREKTRTRQASGAYPDSTSNLYPTSRPQLAPWEEQEELLHCQTSTGAHLPRYWQGQHPQEQQRSESSGICHHKSTCHASESHSKAGSYSSCRQSSNVGPFCRACRQSGAYRDHDQRTKRNDRRSGVPSCGRGKEGRRQS